MCKALDAVTSQTESHGAVLIPRSGDAGERARRSFHLIAQKGEDAPLATWLSCANYFVDVGNSDRF
jgi:hypothetical protein